jgi:hypothetical protein
MNFSYSAVWEDMLGLLKANSTIIIALAGVFMLLPALLVAYLLPMPETADISRMWMLMGEYFSANWHWLLLESLVSMIGGIAILLLVLDRGGTTVGGAIAAAVALLPFYFIAALLAGFIIGFGFVLLILPGLYLFGRLAPLGPVVVAERRRNPIDALQRTFAITKGNGWAVLGLVLLIGIAAVIAMFVVNMILGLIFILVAGQELGRLLTMIVEAATGAALGTLLILLYAAIYRALSGRGAAAAASA